MKIILLGYMASGKTFIANELSRKMDLKHIDLDIYIEQKEGNTIAEIFEKRGEIYFRVIENKYLLELLQVKEDFILSVGGGTPCYANNMDLIKKHTTSFFLKATINTIYDRLINEKEQRPLVKSIPKDKLREFIAKHLFERNVYYELADYQLKIDNKNSTKIIEEIIELTS